MSNNIRGSYFLARGKAIKHIKFFTFLVIICQLRLFILIDYLQIKIFCILEMIEATITISNLHYRSELSQRKPLVEL